MNPDGSLVEGQPAPARLWRRLLWVWAGFWLLLFLLGLQEYLWSGGRQLWRPLVDYGASAFLATALAAVQIRRASRFDALLSRPARWFARMWVWMPLQLVGFVVAMNGLRWLFNSLAGDHYGG